MVTSAQVATKLSCCFEQQNLNALRLEKLNVIHQPQLYSTNRVKMVQRECQDIHSFLLCRSCAFSQLTGLCTEVEVLQFTFPSPHATAERSVHLLALHPSPLPH